MHANDSHHLKDSNSAPSTPITGPAKAKKKKKDKGARPASISFASPSKLDKTSMTPPLVVTPPRSPRGDSHTDDRPPAALVSRSPLATRRKATNELIEKEHEFEHHHHRGEYEFDRSEKLGDDSYSDEDEGSEIWASGETIEHRETALAMPTLAHSIVEVNNHTTSEKSGSAIMTTTTTTATAQNSGRLDGAKTETKIHAISSQVRSIPLKLEKVAAMFTPQATDEMGELIASWPAVYVKQHRPSHGKIFVFPSHVLFESFTRNTFVSIPISEFQELFVPNLRPGIKIVTQRKAYKFGGLLHKQRLYLLLQQLWGYAKGQLTIDFDALRAQMAEPEDDMTMKLEKEKVRKEKREKKIRKEEEKDRERQREIKEKQDKELAIERERKEKEREKIEKEKEAEREKLAREREKQEKKEREKREKQERKEKEQQEKLLRKHKKTSSGRSFFKKKKVIVQKDEYEAKVPPRVLMVPDCIHALRPPHRQCELTETLNTTAARAWFMLFGEAGETPHFMEALTQKLGHSNVAFSSWIPHNADTALSDEGKDGTDTVVGSPPPEDRKSKQLSKRKLKVEMEKEAETTDEYSTDGPAYWQRGLSYGTKLNTKLAAGEFVVDQTQRTCRLRNGKYVIATESKLNRLPWDGSFVIHSYWHIKESEEVPTLGATVEPKEHQALIKIWLWTEWYKTPPAFFRGIIEESVEAKHMQGFMEAIASARRILDKEEHKRALLRKATAPKEAAAVVAAPAATLTQTPVPIKTSVVIPNVHTPVHQPMHSAGGSSATTKLISQAHPPPLVSAASSASLLASTSNNLGNTHPDHAGTLHITHIIFAIFALLLLYYYWQTQSLATHNAQLAQQVEELQRQIAALLASPSPTPTLLEVAEQQAILSPSPLADQGIF